MSVFPHHVGKSMSKLWPVAIKFGKPLSTTAGEQKSECQALILIITVVKISNSQFKYIFIPYERSHK